MKLYKGKFTNEYLNEFFELQENDCLFFLTYNTMEEEKVVVEEEDLLDVFSPEREEKSKPPLETVIKQVLVKYGKLKNSKDRMAIQKDILKCGNSMNSKNAVALYFKLLFIGGYVEDLHVNRMLLSLSSLNSDREKKEYFCSLMFKYPFGIMVSLPKNINNVIARLDKKLFGMAKAKKKLKEYLSLLLFTQGKGKVSPLLLVGPPGTGKTSLAYTVADVLGLPFIKISLSGNYDVASIKGASSTWSSGKPGLIIQEIAASGCTNPVMLLDEIDKSGFTSAGSVLDILTEILDCRQNDSYTDSFLNFPVDLSKVIYISTANQIGQIPNHIVDRCFVIEVDEYSEKEREEIIMRYFPDQIKKEEMGIRKKDFRIEMSPGVAKKLSLIKSLRQPKRHLLSLVADKISEKDNMNEIRTIYINECGDLPETEAEKKQIGFLR